MIRPGLEFSKTSGKVSARKDSSHYIVSTGPDVCKTPMGRHMVPVAYSTIAFFRDSVRTNPKVRLNGRVDFHINSRISKSYGMEPGIGRGVKDSGYKGPAQITEASTSVKSAGYDWVRHKDPALINKSSLD